MTKYSPRTHSRFLNTAALVLTLSFSTVAPAFATQQYQPGAGTQTYNPTTAPLFDAPIDSGGVAADLETGEVIPEKQVSRSDLGYNHYDGIRYTNGDYTLKLIASPQIEQLRPSIAAAVTDFNKTGTVNITIANETIPAKPRPAIRGEIYMEVSTVSICEGSSWAGCGGPLIINEDGVGKAVAGQTWIHPMVLNFTSNQRQHVIAHELGHALSLLHYDKKFAGKYQLMHSSSYDSTVLAAGDLAGVNYLEHPKPFGNFEEALGGTGTFTVRGWALDGLNNGAISVQIMIDDAYRTTTQANAYRPDVESFYRRGGNHGFSATVVSPPGEHRICLYAKHNKTTMSTQLACRYVKVR
ncbi:hypothetical protein [Lysinibacter sp. HNR]|uniref:hypothetical protein n=1 Tax=Lysinibacter sp. HNR TaxID=3031408 RepID=UPI00243612C5|nr:hypothetical protein [Lysinibacter sp. HNR]WGD36435.1 hypothetical protein FrondiHNR_08075 [Lysinibacter sp. HNR]